MIALNVRPGMKQAGVRLAPELAVTMWFNGYEPLTLAQLRGREGSAHLWPEGL
jgi:hypothetical protein